MEWKSVLPVCQHCLAEGALPLARTKRRNVARNARRATRVRLTAPAPQAAVADDISLVEGSDIPPSLSSNAPRITKRRRKAGPSFEPSATRSRRNSRVRG